MTKTLTEGAIYLKWRSYRESVIDALPDGDERVTLAQYAFYCGAISAMDLFRESSIRHYDEMFKIHDELDEFVEMVRAIQAVAIAKKKATQ